MPAVTITEPPAAKSDPRPSAGRGRASGDSFDSALTSATLPQPTPAALTWQGARPQPQPDRVGGSPTTPPTAASPSSLTGPRPAALPSAGPVAPVDTQAQGLVPGFSAATIPNATAPAGSGTPDAAPRGPAPVNPLPSDAQDASLARLPNTGATAADGVAAPLPARHEAALPAAAAARRSQTRDTPTQADPALSVDGTVPALTPPPPAATAPTPASLAPPEPPAVEAATPAGVEVTSAIPHDTARSGPQAGTNDPITAPADSLPAPSDAAIRSGVDGRPTEVATPAVTLNAASASPGAAPTPRAVPVPPSQGRHPPADPPPSATLPAASPSPAARTSPAQASPLPAPSVPAARSAHGQPDSSQSASIQPAAGQPTIPDASQPPARHPSADPTASLAPAAAQSTPAQDSAAQPVPAQASPGQDLAQATAPATAQPGPSALPPASTQPGTTPAVTSATPPPSPAAQVIPAMLAVHTANGAQNTMLRLTPAELGTVQIQISRDHDGAAAVSVLVERPETLRLLLHDQAQLQHALTQAGLPQDRTLSFQQAPPGSFASQDHRAAQDRGQDPDQNRGQAAGDPGQPGRDGDARQGGSRQGQDTRSGSGHARSGIHAYASAWQPAGVDITA